MKRPLTGKRILVPPARPEANPLSDILKRRGAEVVEFPRLGVAGPGDVMAVDRAQAHLDDFDWILFSGSNSVLNFMDRLGPQGWEILRDTNRIGAIGHGAVSALRKAGIDPGYIPKMHTAEAVLEGLGDVSGVRFLLVRVDGASRDLPDRLGGKGAAVTEISGYRMVVEASREGAREIFDSSFDALALANPTAVRFLVKGIDIAGLDLDALLQGVLVAAVGPVTAREARRRGIEPGIVSKGHIADLAESLTEFYHYDPRGSP